MIIVKLKEGFEDGIPKSCNHCPFIQSYPELDDYGESLGYDNYDCGLTGTDIGPSYDLKRERLSDCPLISIEKIES